MEAAGLATHELTVGADRMQVLIVDDEEGARRSLARVVGEEGHEALEAPGAEEAWCLVRARMPDVVLADYRLRGEANGLDLLERIRALHGHVIVVIMTANGSEQLAAEAIRRGAGDYLRKPIGNGEMRSVLRRYAGLVQDRASEAQIVDRVRTMHVSLELDNNLDRVTAASQYLLRLCAHRLSEEERLGVRLGLHEMIVNAIEHGNLGITFAEKSSTLEAGPEKLKELYARRLAERDLAARRVTVDFAMEASRLEWTIADEGAGFDWRTLRDPITDTAMTSPHGRGVFLTRMQFDTMEYLDRGNVVRLVKRLDRGASMR